MGGWARPRLARDQITLFSPTLDDWIAEDHPVRLFDEILSTLDGEVERLLSESEETDRQERRLLGDDRPGHLPRELSALKGRRLRFVGTETKTCASGPVQYRRYVCADCTGCGLSTACRSGRGPRSVKRDGYEAVREATAARLRSEHGQAVYARRLWLCETPFAVLKRVMGLRQFLLRGRWKVGLEWLWSCTAYNLRKLMGEVAGLRARFAALSG